MSSGGKRWRFNNLFTSSCRCRPTATDAVEPKLKSETESDQKLRRHCASSSASSGERHGGFTSSTSSLSTHTDSSQQMMSPFPKINDSVAVAKDSDDPYGDFRQSMLEMISEKEMYSRSDLQQLLRCFLDLNPPHHHDVILRAFMDIWNADDRTPPSSAA